MMFIRRGAMVLAAMVAIGAASATRAQTVEGPRQRADASTVGIVSAGGDPAAIRVVNDLASALNSDTLRILPIVGQGPVQDIADLFHLQGADAAIVASDVLPYLLRERRLPGAAQSLRYVAKLDEDEVHVLARREITSVADLAGRKVNFDARDSRAFITGTVLFDSLKVNVEPVSLDQSQALQALRRGEIAALICVAKKPARLFFDLNRDDGVHFVPLPLTSELSRTYLPARLGPEDYPLLIGEGEAGRGAPVSTVAVPMVLAVRDWSRGAKRYRDLSRMVDALFPRAAALQGSPRNTLWTALDPAAEVPGWRRFAPAEAWLKGEVAVGSGTSAPTDQQQFQSPREKEALFGQFLRWQQQQHGSDERPPDQEKRFEEFLRSRQHR